MRQPLIAGNWKMFKTVHEAVVLRQGAARAASRTSRGVEIVVAPPFTALHAVAEAARDSDIGVAAQNCHWEREGAFTGEVSAAMVREAGAGYVIVGHSERRTLFGETDDTRQPQVGAALAAGLMPIVCIGETLRAARGEPDARRARPAGAARARRRDGGAAGGAGRGLRAGVGDRHRPQRHARAGQEAHAHIRIAPAAVVRRRRRRRVAASSTAAA